MPLQTVIIPTFNRPALLKQAIGSALDTALGGDIEVVVVPNGPSDEWHAVAECLSGDQRVKWHPIEHAQVSVARNVGLHLSNGKFVRFLDDDDRLLPAAASQCKLLDQSAEDVSQGAILRVNAQGNLVQRYDSVQTNDFVESTLTGRIFTLCHSFLWRRRRIENFRWNVDLKANEDVAWALGLAAKDELSMQHFPLPVGCWVNHSNASISRDANQATHDMSKALVLLDLAEKLECRRALTPERRTLIGRHLWDCIHTSFPNAPVYWSKVALRTKKISPGSRPDLEFLDAHPLLARHPLLLEILMTPHRSLRDYNRRSHARLK